MRCLYNNILLMDDLSIWYIITECFVTFPSTNCWMDGLFSRTCLILQTFRTSTYRFLCTSDVLRDKYIYLLDEMLTLFPPKANHRWWFIKRFLKDLEALGLSKTAAGSEYHPRLVSNIVPLLLPAAPHRPNDHRFTCLLPTYPAFNKRRR